MSTIYFVLLLVICWQPLYLTGMMVYHLIKKDNTSSVDYWKSLAAWWKKLISLVFSDPTT